MLSENVQQFSLLLSFLLFYISLTVFWGVLVARCYRCLAFCFCTALVFPVKKACSAKPKLEVLLNVASIKGTEASTASTGSFGHSPLYSIACHAKRMMSWS